MKTNKYFSWFQQILFNVTEDVDSFNKIVELQSKGPGLDTQRSGNVPLFTEKLKKNSLLR